MDKTDEVKRALEKLLDNLDTPPRSMPEAAFHWRNTTATIRQIIKYLDTIEPKGTHR